MRCSLLALSSYIDTELDAEPTGELEAHLVACDRCRTAVGHLREESARIGALARVHVPDDAVHDLFSQIGLIAEEDDLPKGPVHRDRRAAVEAPPWFGAERGAALPWAPRPTGGDQTQPRELIGERSSGTLVAEPPELYLWDETIDQIATAVPVPPPVQVAPAPEPLPARKPVLAREVGPMPMAQVEAEPAYVEPLPPQIIPAEPQPPDLSTSAPMMAAPRLAAGPNALQRLRDAVAVRLALRRGAGSRFDSGVEIVSGAGAPTWNQRARSQHWSESPPVAAAATPPVMADATAPVVAAATPPVMADATAPVVADATAATAPDVVPLSPPPVVKPNRLSRFMARVAAEPVVREPALDVSSEEAGTPQVRESGEPVESASSLQDADQRDSHQSLNGVARLHEAGQPANGSAPLELADVLNEVAILAAPLERPATPVVDVAAPAPTQPSRRATVSRAFDRLRANAAPIAAPQIDAEGQDGDDVQFGVNAEPASTPVPGRHVRRLQAQKPDRREWNPTRPVTGRHVLPLGGPAVGAADRDQRLWLFGAITVVLMLLGLLIGRQVTQTGPLAAATIPRSAPSSHATTPATSAPLPIATPAPVPTAIIPVAPTPQQLTGATTLGNGSGGFSVADVRYGLHPNDFRLVFDLAFPSTVTGAPTTVIGYSGATTMYVEFTGVDGVSNVAVMPTGKIVVSVVPLPMARNTDRLIFKITLSKHAPFDAYYLSGARLVIDVT
jgi:hypothetical protein